MVHFTGDKQKVSVAVQGKGKGLAGNLAVLSPEDFLEDFEREAWEAKERVIGQSLTFEAKKSGEIVTRIFAETAPKHVRKQLLLDWYTKLETDQQLTTLAFFNPFTRKKLLKDLAKKEGLWAQMKRVGVDVGFTNKPRNFLENIFPVTGRNHMKAAGVDSRAFYIGGFNYGNLELNLADFMVKFTNRKIVDQLFEQWERANGTREVNDYQTDLREDFQLLVDGGQSGSSVIMDRAAKEIRGSKAFVLAVTSGLFPNGLLAQELENANRRGVKVESICGRIKVKHHWPISNIHLYWLVAKLNQFIFRLKKYSFSVLMEKKQGVHAKLLIVDGKIAIIGSHNFSDAGIKAGTKEWSMVTTNEELIGNLMKFYVGLREEVVGDSNDKK